MGLFTVADVMEKGEKKFIQVCKNWLKEHELYPSDVCLWWNDEIDDYCWDFQDSKVLGHGLRDFMEVAIIPEEVFDYKLDFYRNMTPEETKEIGEKAGELIMILMSELSEHQIIPNGWEWNGRIQIRHFSYAATDLKYYLKQARWFLMVGECGYGTKAIY